MSEDLDIDNLTVNMGTFENVLLYLEKSEKLLSIQICIFLIHLFKDYKKQVQDYLKWKYNPKKNNLIEKLYRISGYDKEKMIAVIIYNFNNIELLIYVLDNNIADVNNLFVAMCEFDIPDLIIYLLSPIGGTPNNNFKYSNGLTTASRNGNLEIVKILLKNNINIDFIGPSLESAVYLGHLEIVKFFVKNGANINKISIWYIDNAIEFGYFDIIKFLFENGLNMRNDFIYRAFEHGQIKIGSYLIKLKAKNWYKK